MALHLAFPALRSVASLLYDILFLFPPHSNLSRVCIVISSGSRQFFPTFIYCGRVGWIAVNRPQMKRLASLWEHTQCHGLLQKPPFSPVHAQQVRSKRFHNTITFHRYFWCSRFFEFQSNKYACLTLKVLLCFHQHWEQDHENSDSCF